MRFIDIHGQKFGMLTAVRYIKGKGWLCRCDCDNECINSVTNLKRGIVVSCGCFNRRIAKETAKKNFTVHGLRHSPEYEAWISMRERCNKQYATSFKNHGAREIKVCARWTESFENFLEDMGIRPSSKHSLDRINNDGNYEPDNCRWATTYQQARNKRNNVRYEYNGLNLILSEWAERTGIKRSTLAMRIQQRKWSIEKALTTPVNTNQCNMR